jgi:hypothetical protein
MPTASLNLRTRVGWWRPEAGRLRRVGHFMTHCVTRPIIYVMKNGLPSVRQSGTIGWETILVEESIIADAPFSRNLEARL